MVNIGDNMKDKIEMKCQCCNKLFWSESKFIRRCPACKKLHTYDPVTYSFSYPYNKDVQGYGT